MVFAYIYNKAHLIQSNKKDTFASKSEGQEVTTEMKLLVMTSSSVSLQQLTIKTCAIKSLVTWYVYLINRRGKDGLFCSFVSETFSLYAETNDNYFTNTPTLTEISNNLTQHDWPNIKRLSIPCHMHAHKNLHKVCMQTDQPTNQPTNQGMDFFCSLTHHNLPPLPNPWCYSWGFHVPFPWVCGFPYMNSETQQTRIITPKCQKKMQYSILSFSYVQSESVNILI